MCLYSQLIINPKYKANKKNGWNPPPVPDERVKYVPIGCQECIECRKQKSRGWQVRLLEDIKKHKNGKFITLTFSNESIGELRTEVLKKVELDGYELENAIATLAVRRFLERWRKKQKTSIRHWLVTELGHEGTENIHIHGIVWTDENMNEVESKWKYGYVWKGKNINGKIINYVNEETVNYICKYIYKTDEIHKCYKAVVLTSPGIGNNYTKGIDWKNNKYKGKDTKETYRTRTGHKVAMPIYWRNKIYSDHEREQLWLHKLDKQERWICGERLDLKKDPDGKTYYRLLEYHRERNRRFGYGTGEKTWDREQYERARRNLLMEQRTGKKNKKEKVETLFLTEINRYDGKNKDKWLEEYEKRWSKN